MFFLQGCGGGSSSTEDVQTVAIEKIKAYAEDQTQPEPTVEDYEDAGVSGVTAENLDDINALVAGLTADDVDTVEEIQAILDEYNLTDTSPPIITLLGITPVNVTQGEVYNDAGATAWDNIDGDITANIVVVNPVDTSTVGTYTVTYNVSDASGNAATEVTRTVNVLEAGVDTTPPVITLLGTTPVTVTLGSIYTDAGATAWDNIDGNITANIVVVNPVDTSTAGTYTVTYNVSDAAGNAATEVTRTVTVTDGSTVDNIVGKTVEFEEVTGTSFSFYPNNKFVRISCVTTCTDGTGTFEYIGTWSGTTNGTDATDLTLLDNLGNPINVVTITSSKDIYYYPISAGDKTLENNVQGDGVRERLANGSIRFVYFRDPDLSGVIAFSYFGFDTVTWDPVGAGGHWQVRDGKVYAYYGTTMDNEISTYAFDRKPVKDTGGPIITVTKGGNLEDVIAVDEYWQLKPSPTIDKTVEVTPVDMVEETFYDKLLLISDKVTGPMGCYFDAPLSVDVNGYVTCAGISLDGSTIWGGKGDNWYINADKDLETKIHYEVAGSNSTTEIWRFNQADPGYGTLVSKYDKDGIFISTSALTDFRPF
jgi:hypothetical protein